MRKQKTKQSRKWFNEPKAKKKLHAKLIDTQEGVENRNKSTTSGGGAEEEEKKGKEKNKQHFCSQKNTHQKYMCEC